VDQIKEIQETIKAMLEPILIAQESLKKLGAAIVYDISYATKQASELIMSFQEKIGSVLKEFQRNFRELPPRTQEAFLLLGHHGWYVDLEMSLPELWNPTKLFLEGNIAEAENALIDHFEGRIDKIEESISKKFPHREKLIRAAFNAHRRQKYELAIPVLFAQVDGICKEVGNEYLFKKDKKKPCIAKYVEQIASDTFRAAILSPLAQTLPIGVSKNERTEEFNELNRHMVMHGETVDYGSKINSLKAISLINYVAHVLMPKKENP
jgi:hypothetical protein